jgi:hypothetical protein
MKLLVFSRRGFTGGHRYQGGWLTAALGLVGSLFGMSSARRQQRDAQRAQQEAIAAGDPYGPYRDAAAQRLNALTYESVVDTPEWKARQRAAERTMAAQGYTGSGNALLAAAEGGGAAYQQAFDNLARQAGIDKQPGYGHNAALSAQNGQNYMNNMSGAFNSATYALSQLSAGLFQGNNNSANTKG